MATRTWYIVGFTVLSVLAALLLPAMPQPVAYHDFADHRTMLGVANFLDVASNVGFRAGRPGRPGRRPAAAHGIRRES